MFTTLLSILLVGLWLLYIVYRKYRTTFKTIALSDSNTGNSHCSTITSGSFLNAPYPLNRQKGTQLYLDLYHKLHNLEDNPGILPTAYQTLVSLLHEGLVLERHQHRARSILELEEYNYTALETFLFAEQEDVYHQWEEYNKRRASGQPAELFQDKKHAKQWLKENAPVKYVDGAWLGHIHKITTPFAVRAVTKNAWQVLSEELGDGELEKNHVYLYQNLLCDVGINLPECNSADFIQPRHGMDNPGVWKAATAQLLISLFPHFFLPEILGFNLHYELVTLETLKASKELPELGISGYYFALHVSIDNADSGHTAMALATVDQYMKWASNTPTVNPCELWKRIQAGYILSATAGNQSLGAAEKRVIDILQRKAFASHRIHCTSKLRIGKKSLAEWLAPHPAGTGKSRGQVFLNELAEARPWVYRGNSEKSLLMRELSWKGKMFGAFTHTEVEEIREWIDSLQTPTEIEQSYWKSVNRLGPAPIPPVFANFNVVSDHPAFPPEPPHPRQFDGISVPSFTPLQISTMNLNSLFCLWFVHPCLLENIINTPCRAASSIGSYIVRLLRADHGFSPETSGVAGLDEYSPRDHYPSLVVLGLEMVAKEGRGEPACLQDAFEAAEKEGSSCAATFARHMLSWSARPNRHWPLLLGLARAFLDLEEWVGHESDLLLFKEKEALKKLVSRKRSCFDGLLKDLEADQKQYTGFISGYSFGRSEIEKILSQPITM